MSDDLDARIKAFLADGRDCWPNAARGFKAIVMLCEAHAAITTLRAERDAARAEVERLREALQGIEHIAPKHPCGQLARATLGERQP
jgi:hypothetical protein